MPVADLAAPDSALFLWATFPQLPEALRLIEAWGFTYKSVAFVWLKKNKKADSWFYGLGFWTRGNAEICLLATKGHPKRQAANIHQFIISPIEAHSKKPDEARRVATALELYCTGSLNLFNHPTNVKTDSRVVCIVLKNMGENLRKIAMHITNEFVSQAVDQNFHEGAATWCYFDEFHILLRDPLTASYFVAVWKMLRKKGCVPSALTQNVKDLLASREIENILDNTDFMILLSQAQSDRTILAKQLGISEHQLSYITHSNSGEGLLFYGNVTIPFVDRFPRGEIYDLLTTRPEDMKNETKNE